MKPSQAIIKFFTSYIINNLKNKLNTLFSSNNFDITNKTTFVSIPSDALIYEQPDTCKYILGWQATHEELCNDEYFVYKASDILINETAYSIFENAKSELYQLVFTVYRNICENTIDIIYDPDKTIPSISESFMMRNLSKTILQEYINVAHRFSGMSFQNHSSSRILHDIPKLTLSINGQLFNRPDIEYYVVFGEGYETYTVQVYTLLSTGRRDEMLFGVWINSKTKQIFDPYIIKLLPPKCTTKKL